MSESNYRIITNGFAYRIQKRVYRFFWITLTEMNDPYTGRVPREFPTRKQAELEIQFCEKIDNEIFNKKWKVCE